MISDSNGYDNEETLFSPLNQVLPYGDEGCSIAKEVVCGDTFTLVLDDMNQAQVYGKGTDNQVEESSRKIKQNR